MLKIWFSRFFFLYYPRLLKEKIKIMTQKEKDLLIQVLCAMLPYGVRMQDSVCPELAISLSEFGCYKKETPIQMIGRIIDDGLLPYLRPMSSMTKEEIEEYRNLSDEVIGSYGPYHYEFIAHCVRLGIKPDNPHECVDDYLNMEAIDWLLKNHFDFRGLIPMGLALPVKDGMYETES